MTQKNIEELSDLELIEMYQIITNFIKYLSEELGDKEWIEKQLIMTIKNT